MIIELAEKVKEHLSVNMARQLAYTDKEMLDFTTSRSGSDLKRDRGEPNDLRDESLVMSKELEYNMILNTLKVRKSKEEIFLKSKALIDLI